MKPTGSPRITKENKENPPLDPRRCQRPCPLNRRDGRLPAFEQSAQEGRDVIRAHEAHPPPGPIAASRSHGRLACFSRTVSTTIFRGWDSLNEIERYGLASQRSSGSPELGIRMISPRLGLKWRMESTCLGVELTKESTRSSSRACGSFSAACGTGRGPNLCPSQSVTVPICDGPNRRRML